MRAEREGLTRGLEPLYISTATRPASSLRSVLVKAGYPELLAFEPVHHVHQPVGDHVQERIVYLARISGLVLNLID